jgi:hypothetical protein
VGLSAGGGDGPAGPFEGGVMGGAGLAAGAAAARNAPH